MTLKNKQSCNGTAYSRKLIIKHRYLFLFGFALILGIIGLEMLLSVVFRQREEGKLYLWFIWYNTPDIKLIKLMFHVLASSTMWLFLSKPFSLFFSPFDITSDKINSKRLTLSIACKKIFRFPCVTSTINANFPQLRNTKQWKVMQSCYCGNSIYFSYSFLSPSNKVFLESTNKLRSFFCFYFSCLFPPIAFHNIYSKHIERFREIIKRFNLSIFV